MLNTTNFLQSKDCLFPRLFFTALAAVLLFSSIELNSKVIGGYTDPKIPGRHSRLNIDSAKIEVIPHGIYAEVSIEFWYRPVDLNKETDTLEMYVFFDLPSWDFINDSWLWVEDTMVHAMIIDVNTATLIYEEIVHRLHKDPSILYRRSTSGRYEYRIYPNVGNKSRHAKISYYTRMNYQNGNADFSFIPTILDLSVNKSIPRNFKFYLNDYFTDIDFGSNQPQTNYSSDGKGDFVEFYTDNSTLQQTFSYQYDFSKPYFTKSNLIDEQEYYFTMYDSKILISNYMNQKINFLIDYDINRTTISKKDVIDQLRKSILTNFSEHDSINIMIGGRNTVNIFNRWVPCHKDTINMLIDSTLADHIGLYSYLSDLMDDGVKFNERYYSNSSIVLLSSSEYSPTPASANPIIENCLQQMVKRYYKITAIDFSDVHYSTYRLNSTNYYGNQYFNEKIAEMTKGEYLTVKSTGSTVFSMLNSAFTNLKGLITDVGLYVEPTDGITISKTTKSIIDNNSNQKLVYEYGKIVGNYPIELKFSGLLDGKPVIQKYEITAFDAVLNNESAKMWNWDYIRFLEDKNNKTKKESHDLTNRSITNRILSTQTAFLCLEPWMMKRDTVTEEEDPETTSVFEKMQEIGLDVSYGPNPAVNKLDIRMNVTDNNTRVLQIQIYDVLGMMVKEFTVDSFSSSINLTWDLMSNNNKKVPPGIYYIVIKTSTGNKTLKLIVV